MYRQVGFGAVGREASHRYRKVGFIVALEIQKVIGLGLEHLAEQHEENQSGHRVEKSRAVVEEHVGRTADEENHDAQGNRDFDAQKAVAQAFPRRRIVAAGRIQKRRQGQHENQRAEETFILVEPEFADLKIFGERQQHDVAETEKCHRQLDHQ